MAWSNDNTTREELIYLRHDFKKSHQYNSIWRVYVCERSKGVKEKMSLRDFACVLGELWYHNQDREPERKKYVYGEDVKFQLGMLDLKYLWGIHLGVYRTVLVAVSFPTPAALF